MSYLLDTSVLLRAFDRDASEHAEILLAIRHLLDRDEQLVVSVQNIAEFWNVSTRPKDKNGFALAVPTVARRIRVIERFATISAESTTSYHEWKRLLTAYQVRGVKVHDARLVSVMIVAAISHVLTLNVRDFQRYAEITPVSPSEVISAQ
jgi:predicted nucleic acid-binding protein